MRRLFRNRCRCACGWCAGRAGGGGGRGFGAAARRCADPALQGARHPPVAPGRQVSGGRSCRNRDGDPAGSRGKGAAAALAAPPLRLTRRGRVCCPIAAFPLRLRRQRPGVSCRPGQARGSGRSAASGARPSSASGERWHEARPPTAIFAAASRSTSPNAIKGARPRAPSSRAESSRRPSSRAACQGRSSPRGSHRASWGARS